jgi:hypothetical protein
MASMPKSGAALPDHRRLVQELAQLSARERRHVMADAQRVAQRQVTLGWKSLRAARGVVALGGDAVADCDDLYDG